MEKIKKPVVEFQQIPKLIHIIWIGDETKMPIQWINSWGEMNKSWRIRIWGNNELRNRIWKTQKQIKIYTEEQNWAGVADLMRYEILLEYGGIYVDADSICVHPIDDWLLDTKMFVCWEHERYRPGLISNGYIGAIPNHPAIRLLVQKASLLSSPTARRDWLKPYWDGRLRFKYKIVEAWKAVGPLFFTETILPFCPLDITVLPSILFMPQHHSEAKQRTSSLIYALQKWGSTHDGYGINSKQIAKVEN